jgi:DNA polymerase elongation subunit (family B)
MLNGNILDIYPDAKKNMMVIWLINRSRAIRIEDKYEPSFYVHSKSENLFNLAAILQELPQIKNLNFTYGKTNLGSDKKKLVLEVTPKNLGSLSKLSTMIDSWGDFHRYQLFNVDIRMPSRYLQDKGVFCNAKVKWDGKNFILDDDPQWATDYKLPSFKTTSLDIKQNTKVRVMSFNDPLKSIMVDDYVICEENEADTILSAVKYILRVNPDIIYTNQGDSSLFPFLYHRARLCSINHMVNLGREDTQRLHPVKKAKSYFSYGQIIYRPAFYILHGRVHIDTYNSFLHNESGLNGLLDISRCSNIPLQYMSRLGPGTAISQMQVNKAMEKGYLIPWKKNIPENWKTAMGLLVSDRGGLILEPTVGLHEDVVELDFASLYPNIMLKYNISPETMFCNCCKASFNNVPQLNYHICVHRKGFIPEVLEPIIHRRFCFKARSKNKNYDKDFYKELQHAWKWILLVCFGYTGYRNARYGRIECHESITAYSRDILLTAMEVAEKAGYDVLHGIIDSLWVKPLKNCIKPFHLSRMISKQTGIRIDVKGHYKWIVFLPSKETKVGALNRYYGVFDEGELKVRGFELRQRNTPIFLKNMQRDILDVFSKADNIREFTELIPFAVDVIKDYGKQIIKGDIDPCSLIFTTRISRDVSEYKVNNLVKSALLQIRDAGVQVELGQSISYIIQDENSRNYRDRVCITESIDDNEKVDVDFYLRQIAKCGESILVPFGYTLEKLFDMLQKIKYREKMNVSILPGIRSVKTSCRLF